MLERELWVAGIELVRDGEVFWPDGRPVHFRALVKRRWGWPKKAAYRAADHILEEAADNGVRAMIWLTRSRRERQQQELFREIPGLMGDLLNGMARGAQREVHDAGRDVDHVAVRFDYPISDDGLSAGVLDAIATRLGTTVVQLREQTHFDRQGTELVLEVNADQFDP